MPGIYIPKLTIPKCGCLRIVIDYDGTVCDGHLQELGIQAIPVPDHGRLGDLDVLAAFAESNAEKYPRWRLSGYGVAVLCRNTEFAPTVITADEEARRC